MRRGDGRWRQLSDFSRITLTIKISQWTREKLDSLEAKDKLLKIKQGELKQMACFCNRPDDTPTSSLLSKLELIQLRLPKNLVNIDVLTFYGL